LNRRKPAKYRFPWREGNRFRLLVDGDEFFPAMLSAIGAARHSVLLENYLFESGQIADRFIAVMVATVGRGVTVQLLLDDFGARLLHRSDRQRLEDAGVELALFNPLRPRRWRRNLLRDHRKLLVVDGQVAYTGGAGITDQFAPEFRPEDYWHDLMLEIRGPLAADWQALFTETWQLATGSPLALAPPQPVVTPAGGAGRVTVHGRSYRQSEIVPSLIKQIRQAEQRVWLATAYFLPSWKLRRALGRAARSGVDVCLLLPGQHSDHPSLRHLSRRYYGTLLRAGIRIFEYQPRFLHTKITLCDGWLSIGSSNLDRWNLHWNLEANQEIADPAVIAQVMGLFRNDFASSREVDYRQWLQRPWHRRILEWVMSLVEGLVRRVVEARWPGPPA
jgi:phosphatidylserine/phosphatidylglycerophosphate/cardiolipin synthase-like enzyme